MNEHNLQLFLMWLDDVADVKDEDDQHARAFGLALVKFTREVHRLAVGDIGAGEGWASIAELFSDPQLAALFE